MLSKCEFYISKNNHHFPWNVYSIKIHPVEFQIVNTITQKFFFKDGDKNFVSRMTDTEWLRKLRRTLSEFTYKFMNMNLLFKYKNKYMYGIDK